MALHNAVLLLFEVSTVCDVHVVVEDVYVIGQGPHAVGEDGRAEEDCLLVVEV